MKSQFLMLKIPPDLVLLEVYLLLVANGAFMQHLLVIIIIFYKVLFTVQLFVTDGNVKVCDRIGECFIYDPMTDSWALAPQPRNEFRFLPTGVDRCK